MKPPLNTPLRRALIIVALLNLGYFGVEFAVALHIGSVSLLADSVDFLEDASVNTLILIAFSWSPRHRAKLGMCLAALLLAPALAGLWTAVVRLASFTPPAALTLSMTGTGALVVNLGCAFLLARHRDQSGSLTRAAFLSARNDAIANIAIICAGLVTSRWPTIWPDLIVGIGIALLNIDAARVVWQAARSEHRDAAA